MAYFMLGFLSVIIIGMVGFFLGLKFSPFKTNEIAAIIGAILGIIIAIGLCISTNEYIYQNKQLTEVVSEVSIVGAEIEEAQINIIPSSYLVYTNNNGIIKISTSNTEQIDSNEYKLVTVSYVIEGWMGFFEETTHEYVIYVPDDILF